MSENPYQWHTKEWWAYHHGEKSGYNAAIEDAIDAICNFEQRHPDDNFLDALGALKKVNE